MPKLIPTVDDLAADEITHHLDDTVAPAGLTNFLGTVRIEHDLTAVGVVQFPPVSQGHTETARLFVDGRLFSSYGSPVTYEWRPDRMRRTARIGDFEIVTDTVCVPGETAVAIRVAVTNHGADARSVDLDFSLVAAVTRSSETWGDAISPSDPNEVENTGDRLIFSSADRAAWSVQGLDSAARTSVSEVAPLPNDFETGIGGNGRGGSTGVTLDIAEGDTAECGWVQAVGTSREAGEATFERVRGRIPPLVAESESYWNHQLEAAFTRGNSEYSGHLPQLETSSDALRRIYWWAALGVIWFRRDFAGNVLGRTYDTLMPNYWGTTTFIWDYSLSSVSHALLDPAEMKRQISQWISLDIHSHFGTSSLTGGPVGRWYSVNDYAMTRLVRDYVTYSGDEAFYDEQVGASETVLDAVRDWASAWQGLRRESDLADYGEIDNLLECVSSYTHEVAGLNAANAWCMRTLADVERRRGAEKEAAELDARASDVVRSVLDLYVPGRGFFAARQPGGKQVPVRHCYDFSVVGTTIASDLDDTTRREMVSFFERELHTPNWMRALSPWDPDASYSVRPDHQWNGAYPAWPADAARALLDLGAPDVVAEWLEGLAETANQGPMGQAHFVDDAQPPMGRGARKAPPQLPYIIDWACSSSGAWLELIIDGLFGVKPGVDGALTAHPSPALRDAKAVLHGVRVAGREFDVHADGRVEEAPRASEARG